jgi:hypothetical protein
MNDPIRPSKSCYEEQILNLPAFKQKLAERMNTENNGHPRRHSLKRPRWVVAVAVITALCLITFVYPTVAEYFNSFSDKLDPGITTAVAKGYSQKIDQSVTDQGITLHVADILIDPTRLVISYKVERNGERSSDLLFGTYDLTDLDGNKIADSWFGTISDKDSAFAYIQLDLPTTDEQQLLLHLDIQKIQPYWNPDLHGTVALTSGHWKMTIPVDLSHSKEATRGFAVQEDYTSPSGDVLTLQQFTFAPSMTRFQIDSKNPHISDLGYDIKDERGNTVLYYDPLNNIKLWTWLSFYSMVEPKNQEITQYFSNIAPLTAGQRYTLEMKDLWSVEPINFVIPLDRSVTKQNPMTSAYQDAVFTITKYGITPDSSGQTSTVTVDIRGDKLPYSWLLAWKLEDEHGTRYPFTFPKSGRESPYNINNDRSYKFNETLVFDNIPSKQKSFKLVLENFPRHEKLDWKIPFTVPE